MTNKVNYKDILTRMSITWIVCYGMITIQVVAGKWISPIWLPYVGLILIGVIIFFGNYALHRTKMHCSMLTHYTVYTLFFSGLIMLADSLLSTRYAVVRYPSVASLALSLRTSLIVYPVAAVAFGIALLRRGKTKYCVACRTMANASITESLRCNVLHHESKFQLRLQFYISVVLSVVIYMFYILYYLRYPDMQSDQRCNFFFYVIPSVAYVIGLVYIIIRYSSLQFEISLKMSQYSSSRNSHIRYMVVWRDRLLLNDIVDNRDHGMYWDTPADVPIGFQPTISEHQASVEFRTLSGLDNFKLRWLFATNYHEQNVFHYAVFIDDAVEDAKGRMPGEWLTLRDVDMLLKSGAIARPFAAELHRVFTITMAWKTYDEQGRRLYPIKNYRPTFRLSDFHTWDVDYEDMRLMSIAENNEDKPFFKLRRFWRRYINGLEKRWEK